MKRHFQILTIVYALLLFPLMVLAVSASWAAPEVMADSAADRGIIGTSVTYLHI